MKVIVIGAGPAGMTAAIAAARTGASVTLLEGMKKPGRKLLITGNGRCNLTNLDPDLISRYSSRRDSDAAKQVIRHVLESFGPGDVLRFFEELGLGWTARDGLIYPLSGQARTVLEVLTSELRRLGVRMKYDARAVSLSRSSGGMWHTRVGNYDYESDRVILCAGGRAAPETGSDGNGYLLAAQAGHSVTSVSPALTGLIAEKSLRPLFRAADGARTRARVRLAVENGDTHILAEEEGELQWTSYGLSGIAVFQLSRFLPNVTEGEPAGGTPVLICDLAPDLPREALSASMRRAVEHSHGSRTVGELITGYTHERTAEFLIKMAGWKKSAYASGDFCSEAASLLKELRIPVEGPRAFDHAQVSSGGVPLDEVRAESLESRIAPGLFLAGELLDADGPCGGYNLQWAWSSGYVAGSRAGTDGP